MDKSLLEHLRIDRNYFPGTLNMLELLQERNGYVPSVVRIVNKIYNAITSHWETIQKKGIKITVKGSWIGEEVKVKVLYKEDLDSSEGFADFEEAEVPEETKKLNNVTITVYLNDRVGESDIKATLEHEFTHLYEYHQRYLKSKGSTDLKGLEKAFGSTVARVQIYQTVKEKAKNSVGLEKLVLWNLSSCFYLCIPAEQNAFIAQLRADLEGKAEELSSYREVAKIVENSSTWKNLKVVKHALNTLNPSKFEGSEDYVNGLISYWTSKFFGTKLSSGRKALAKISYEIEAFERRLKSRVGKMCGEILQNYV